MMNYYIVANADLLERFPGLPLFLWAGGPGQFQSQFFGENLTEGEIQLLKQQQDVSLNKTHENMED